MNYIVVSRSIVYNSDEPREFQAKTLFGYNKEITDKTMSDIRNSDFQEKYKKDIVECLKVVSKEKSDILRCYGYIDFCLYGKIPLVTLFNVGGNPKHNYEKYHLIVDINETLSNHRKIINESTGYFDYFWSFFN